MKITDPVQLQVIADLLAYACSNDPEINKSIIDLYVRLDEKGYESNPIRIRKHTYIENFDSKKKSKIFKSDSDKYNLVILVGAENGGD